MRESVAALALICREEDGQMSWLAQWNRSWQRYHFVGGHKHEDESFRECAIREIEEELAIAGGQDFVVADHPEAHVEYTGWSEGAQEETHYVTELFSVRLIGEAVCQQVAANPQNRWLTEAEIRDGCCRDGSPVSETMAHLIAKANLWSQSTHS